MSSVVLAIHGILFIVVFVSLTRIYVRAPYKKVRRFASIFHKTFRDYSLSEYEAFIFQLSYSFQNLAKDYTGALVVIERDSNLQRFVTLGYEVKTKLTSEFLMTVFSNKKSALHDGGVIIRGFDIVSVSSYFPVTQGRMVTDVGARHRAAVGVTEETDAIALIVSETTGKVSYSKDGKLYEITYDGLGSLASQLFEILHFYID